MKSQVNRNDWKDSKDIVLELIETHGAEKSIAMLLMSLGNTFKHMAHNISEEKYNEIMKDPVIGMSANFSLRLMNAGDVLLKKYGIRK